MTEKPNVTLPGKVEKIIESVDSREPDKAEISVDGAEELYQELRIENSLTDENCARSPCPGMISKCGLSHSRTRARKLRMTNERVFPKYPSDGFPTRAARAKAWAVMIIDAEVRSR